MRKNLFLLMLFASPLGAFAQVADDIHSLHSVLDTLYTDMLPLCEQFISVARGIAGFGALFFIAFRVWGHLAKSEPIDFTRCFGHSHSGFVSFRFRLCWP